MNPESTIYQVLPSQSLSHSNQVAILNINDQSITYGELFVQINYLIKQLRLLGIKQEDKIAIALPNGVEMALTFLSVMNTAICCPLNPNYRKPEYEFYLSDLKAKALITQTGVSPAVMEVAKELNILILNLIPSSDKGNLLTLERFYSAESKQKDGIAPLELNKITNTPPQASEIALILHTSGTTSRPKKVPLTHCNLFNCAHNIKDTLHLTSSDRYLNFQPLFHIHGIGMLLSSLLASSSVICTCGFFPPEFSSWIKDYQPTWYSTVPTIHQQILAQLEQYPNLTSSHNLRFIRSASAPLPVSVLKSLEQLWQIPVIEAYGMTETANQITSNPLPPKMRKLGSVGIRINTEVAIINDQGEMLGNTEIGEVVTKGNNVIKGYLDNPQANEDSYLEEWFRTGDLGYLDQDGYLFLKGRVKEVINRGGEKVMPLEVDNAVMKLEQVYQAVTFGVTHPTLGEDVVTAVVLKLNQSITAQEIRAYLFENLVDFKVPTQVILVDGIPKGATGKLQRLGLADKLADALQAEKIAPKNETETQIAQIFQEILQQDSVSIYDNFFALGGDSLKGTQAVNRLNKIFNLNLINVILFQKPTIAELAVEITARKEQEKNEDIEKLASQLENLSPEEISQLLKDVKQF